MASEKRASSASALDDAACSCLEKFRSIFVQRKESVYSKLFFRDSNVIVYGTIAPIDLEFF